MEAPSLPWLGTKIWVSSLTLFFFPKSTYTLLGKPLGCAFTIYLESEYSHYHCSLTSLSPNVYVLDVISSISVICYHPPPKLSSSKQQSFICLWFWRWQVGLGLGWGEWYRSFAGLAWARLGSKWGLVGLEGWVGKARLCYTWSSKLSHAS